MTRTNDLPASSWSLRTKSLTFESGPAVMGILNTTPDSFSDGGHHNQTDAAVRHGINLASDGADIIDIGGESTRPYSEPVSVQEELDRTIPVIERLGNETNIPISIDTSKSVVAEEALKAGAEIINDVTGLESDRNMISVARKFLPGICAMHMLGTPQNMQDAPSYQDVQKDIFSYLDQRKKWLLENEIPTQNICLDPGIGFGKTHKHNWILLQKASRFLSLGCPILVGHSRKGFIGQLQEEKDAERDSATAGIAIHLANQGIQIIRVHNVQVVKRTLAAYQMCL